MDQIFYPFIIALAWVYRFRPVLSIGISGKTGIESWNRLLKMRGKLFTGVKVGYILLFQA